MRLLLTIGAYLGTLAVVAAAAFLAVIVLAGPHGGLLPRALEGAVLVLGWLAVLLVPAWVAWIVWRRGRAARPGPAPDGGVARKKGARASF
jgi:hypothetical protein